MSKTAANPGTSDDSDVSFFKGMAIQAGSAALVKSVVEFCLEMDQPVGLFGRAGIGKTEIVKQIAKERNMDLVILYLAHVDKEDISGFPFPDPEDPHAVLMRIKKHLPREKSKRNGTILFLDEWNRGERPVVNAMFTLMEHPRRAGDLTLPDDVRIVLSGNNSDAQYSVNEAEKEPAIRRRVCWLGLIANPASWLEHATRAKFHPAVIGYIRKHKQALYDTEAHNAGKVGANPATWEKVSRALYKAEDLGGLEENANTLRGVISGFLGVHTTSDFMTEALHEDAQSIDPEEVLSGFAPGTDIYNRVKKMVNAKSSGSSGKIGQLCSAIAMTVATLKPEPVKVAASIGEFCNIIDSDNAQKFIQELVKTMEELDDAGKTYSRAMSKAVASNPAYIESRKRLTDKMATLDAKIKEKK